MPGFDEHRICVDCGKPYTLPTDYEKANPLIRDRCLDCIAIMQREREKTNEQEWF